MKTEACYLMIDSLVYCKFCLYVFDYLCQVGGDAGTIFLEG